jgi:hypothetical protein
MVALAPGLSFCTVDDSLVFLDVRNDRYFALSEKKARRFLDMVTGAVIRAEIVDEFVADHILVRDRNEEIRAADVQPARREWRSREVERSRSSPLAVFRGVSIIGTTWLSLRLRSFEANLACKQTATVGTTGSPADLKAFFIAYRIFPLQIDCLPTSLALRRFLAIRGIRPALVLGVRVAPFGAHCWLQIDDQVVGDTIERVRAFTPIRVIP